MPARLLALSAALALFACARQEAVPVTHERFAEALLSTTFAAEGADPLRDSLAGHEHCALSEGSLRVSYVGYPRGSERVVMRPRLSEGGDEMTLCYDVRFPAGFDFGKHGKLHGLGPADPITGGKEMRPDGWSARVSFEKGGGIATYLYRQDKSGKYGTANKARRFRFGADRWHAVSLQVTLNTPGEDDGSARLYVDGELLVHDKSVSFRGVGTPPSQISTLLFSTFHGGQSKEYSPRDADGEITTVHARFDNFAVHRGAVVRPAPLDS